MVTAPYEFIDGLIVGIAASNFNLPRAPCWAGPKPTLRINSESKTNASTPLGTANSSKLISSGAIALVVTQS